MQHLLRFAAIAVFVIPWNSVASAEDSIRVFVYSQRETPARSWMPIVCDGMRVADVKRGFFFVVNVSPGRHSLSVTDGVPVSVEASSGKEVFVRVDWNHELGRSPIPVLSRVEMERAKKEMRFLSYVDDKRIHSDAVPLRDPRPAENPSLKVRARQ